MRLIPLFLALGLLSGLARSAGSFPSAQEDARDALAKHQAYLERKPYHGGVFERLTHIAVEQGRLEELTASYALRLKEDPGDLSARVLAARLAMRAGEPQAALELLEPLEATEAGDAPLWRLRGELHLALGEAAPACEALERAAAGYKDARLAGETYVLLGRTRLRQGKRSEARRAFEAFAELDPGSFAQRLESAALLEESGMEEPTLQALAAALELAGGQASQEVRVLAARGRVLEEHGRATEAEEAYAQAMERLGRGHWQRGELFQTRLALHRASGTLDAFVEALEPGANSVDPESRAFLARALHECGDADRALQILMDATEAFPSELELGLTLAESLIATQRTEEAVAEYQRLAARHPNRPGLHRSAGVLLAGVGDLNAARRQWALELARSPRAVDVHLDLARLHGRFGDREREEDLLRAAEALDPSDMRWLQRLIQNRQDQGRGSSVSSLLIQATAKAIARGDADLLEELAGEWSLIDKEREAAEAIEAAFEAGGDAQRLLSQLSNLWEDLGEDERALQALRQRFALAQEPEERVDLAWRIGSLRRVSESPRTLERHLRRELEALPDGAGDPAVSNERLVLACTLALVDRVREGRRVLGLTKEDSQSDDEVRLWAAERIARQAGFVDGAVAALRRLIALEPRRKMVLLPKIAKLLRRSNREKEALAVEQELLRLAPNRPSVSRELAEAELRRKNPAQAAKYYEHTLELSPGNGEVLLALGKLELQGGDLRGGRDRLAPLLRSSDEALRGEAFELMEKYWIGGITPESEQLRLARELGKDPRDCEAGILLILVHMRRFDFFSASEVLQSLLRRYPREPGLLELRDRLRGLVPGDRLAGWAPGALNQDARLVRSLLVQGSTSVARRALDDLDSPILAAQLAMEAGAHDLASGILRPVVRQSPAEASAVLRLAWALLSAERESEAMRHVAEAARLEDYPWELTFWLAERYASRNRLVEVRRLGEILLAKLPSSRAIAKRRIGGKAWHAARVTELAALFDAVRQTRRFVTLAEASLQESIDDPDLFDATLDRMELRQRRRAQALIALARKRRSFPQTLVSKHAARFEGGR